MFEVIAVIAIIYFIYWLIVNVIIPFLSYVIPISGVLAAASLTVGVGCAFILSVYYFGKSLVKNRNPYTTYVDKNKNITSGVHRSYFFGPGFHQIRIIVRESFGGLKKRTEKIFISCKKNTNLLSAVFIWIFFIAYCISIYVFGCIILSLFSILLATVIFTGTCIFFMMFSIFWGLDRLTLVINSIQSRCPNDKRISVVPVFVCPKCGTEHKNLTPGPYGIFSRKCSCGKRLSTAFITGRSKLKAICPYCANVLASSGARQYGIQLIGGVNTGKTTFLAAFWHIYLERIKKRSYIKTDKNPVYAFDELEHWYQQGLSSSTTETNANMYSVIHKHRIGTPYQLTIYDIAGEAFVDLGGSMQQQQFKYCEGLIFVVDPTTEPKNAADTFSSFINEFKRLKGKHTTKTSSIPAAVIISKSDLYQKEINKQIELNSIKISKNETKTRNRISREFLANHGYDNVINLLEGEFSKLQYSSVSAMGHEAVIGQPYEPWGVAESLIWLFSHSSAPFYEYLTSKFRFNKLLKNLLFKLIKIIISISYLAIILSAFTYLFFFIKPYVGPFIDKFGSYITSFKSSNESVLIEQTEPFSTGIVSLDLNVRAGPSPFYERISILPQNAVVKILDRSKSENWVIINYNNEVVGYVDRDYLKDFTEEAEKTQNSPGLYVDGLFQDEMSLKEAINWILQNANENQNYTIVLGTDQRISPTDLFLNNLKINITLKATGTERKIQYNTIQLLAFLEQFQPSASLFTVGKGVTLILENGVSLVGLQNVNSQALIHVDGGTFIMNGGSIKDNNNRGVRVENGTFIMNNGSISGNTITGNNSNNPGGGGIVISNESTFTMNGGIISNNSSYGGGGVFLYSGTFIMNNGTIERNSAETVGGGVLVNNGTFIMRNGIISGNSAGLNGGGVSVQGTFTKFRGFIYGYDAEEGLSNRVVNTNNGHAVYFENGRSRNTTAGENRTMNTGQQGSAGGWE
jgi:GTPase SAR1 family protein